MKGAGSMMLLLVFAGETQARGIVDLVGSWDPPPSVELSPTGAADDA